MSVSSHGILQKLSKIHMHILHIRSSNHRCIESIYNLAFIGFQMILINMRSKDITHAWAHVQSQLLFNLLVREKWVRAEVGRSRDFVLLCQAQHKHLMCWCDANDTIIHQLLYGAHIAGVVHTCQLVWWWWCSWRLTIWTRMGFNVFMHANLSVLCFPCCCTHIHLWKQLFVTFVEESLATIQEHEDKPRNH
jgi:hypothetical protein